MRKPFVISCDDDKYKAVWEEFLTDDVRSVLNRACKSAINKGIGYVYPWIDSNGNLCLLDMISQTIYPAWKDVAHTELDAIVRDYTVTEYTNQTPIDVRKVEFWDRQIVERFIDYSLGNGSGDLAPDNGTEHALDAELEDRASIINTYIL